MATVGDLKKMLEGKDDNQEVGVNIVEPKFAIVIQDLKIDDTTAEIVEPVADENSDSAVEAKVE